jgi:Tol biopolymer transport system component
MNPSAILSALCVVVLTIATSCDTSDDPSRDEARGRLDLEGRVLAFGFLPQVVGPGAGTEGSDDLKLYDLASGKQTTLHIPANSEVLDAFWAEDGQRAFTFVRSALGGVGFQLYEVAPGEKARPVGRALQGEPGSWSVNGTNVLVGECTDNSRLSVLNLNGPEVWEEVAPGCRGAFTPDGSEITYRADRHHLESVPIAGGPSQPFADLRFVDDPERGRIEVFEVVDLDWHGPHLIVTISAEGRYNFAVGNPRDGFSYVPMEDVPSDLGVAGQPGTDLLVLSQRHGTPRVDGLIRMYDPETKKFTVAAAGAGGYFEPTWSPSGDVMLASAESGNWIFTDPSGEWLDVRKVPGLLATDWAE